MTRWRMLHGGVVACLLTAVWLANAAPLKGQGGQRPAGLGESISSLSEFGQSLVVTDVSRQTGRATFARTQGRGLLLVLNPGASAETRAMRFVEGYGAAFGLNDVSEVTVLRRPHRDDLGLEHVRLQQLYRGVPVRGGELIVHLNGARVMAANGRLAAEMPDDVTPAIAAAVASAEARGIVEKYYPDQSSQAQYAEPRLEIFDRALLSDRSSEGPRLAWFVEATGFGIREFVWVDAKTGQRLLNFSQLPEAKSRRVYTLAHATTGLPGTLVRSEGGAATGDADQDNAYTYSGLTYDYYSTNHGRDSFDNAGAAIISTAHYGTNYQNAYWSGTQMVYGDGFASADDVVAHELTHAVTDYSANLFYYVQSGALNESFSDIFGETVDQTDGVGNDAASVKWRMGEDLSIGAIRDMMTPTSYSDPGKMSDSTYFVCSSSAYTDNSDSGGVHTNSGIPNHAFALMTDGGTYNGRTISGIGLTKAAKVEYRALTVYLTSGSGFIDNYNALNQSCSDLIGTAGISSSDCAQVASALLAVEMNATWPCSGATAVPAPALCPSGTLTTTVSDTFESSLGNWSATNSVGSWSRVTGLAKGGTRSAWGTDTVGVSDHRLSLTTAVTVPAGGRMYFDQAFEFENQGTAYYDGGVLEYSSDNGTTWLDAGGFIDAGKGYGGTITSGFGNPLSARSAFVKSSFGYTGTRLDLSSLAGSSVKFRFRIGTDTAVSSLGWFVDNVQIYTCATPTPGVPSAPASLSATAASNGTIGLSWAASSGATSYNVKRSTSAGTETTLASGVTSAAYTDANVSNGVKYYYVVSAVNVSGESANSNEASATAAISSGVRRVPVDYDHDGVTDLAVFRPSTGAWFFLKSSTGFGSGAGLTWGNSTDTPVPGDYDGDGIVDLAVYRASRGDWYILKSSTSYASPVGYTWGVAGDVPVPGDYDGDGKTDLAVYRPSTGAWFILKSSTNFVSGVGYTWGTSTDTPVPGDYDGDGKTDIAVYRPSTGAWFLLKSSANFTGGEGYTWGAVGDVPVPGDYDGDGKNDLAVYRPSTGAWFFLKSSTSYTGGVGYTWGVSTDTPVPGDYDGDGKTDIAVYRPSTGAWYILKSSTTFTAGVGYSWGAVGDIPIVRWY